MIQKNSDTTNKPPQQPIVVKKYANRRLYDTSRSSYVTLDDLYEMIREGLDFVVYDAKTGEDLTRSVLTQIIVDKEAGSGHMLPTGFLKQLIGFYGDNIQSLVPDYLEHSLDSFSKKQEDFRKYFSKSIEGIFSVNPLEEMTKTNIAIFERTMEMFAPSSGRDSTASTTGVQRKKELEEMIRRLQEELKNL
ncbi:MAG: polyhydroxyalkanoate synthesis repressor PhaR [Chloroflexota bacterium]|nr:polyhydroxyalkanoate synthesis repressor PhaR [Chloroflexota bacterium]